MLEPAGTRYYHRTKEQREAGACGRARERQSWEIGDKVNVGFVKGLTVMGRHQNGDIHLSKGEKHYAFVPHGGGLMAVDAPEKKDPRAVQKQRVNYDLTVHGEGKPYGKK
jgi:hypothetical protein